MTSHGPSTVSGGIPWDELIKFAEEKKAEEAKTGHPAQLNKQQIAAISQLIELVHEIEVEDFWVSDLNQYCQQNKIPTPQFTQETFNQQVYGMPFPRSRVFCNLPSENIKFPQEGRGYETGQQVPTFKKVQKAKNFAAMHALKYLRIEEPAPRGSKRAPPESQESPTHARIKKEKDNSDGGLSMATTSLRPGARSVPTSTPLASATTHGPTVRERVAGLGERMGFGIPEYHIEQDNEQEDTWKGRPIFRHDGRIPENMGVVDGAVRRQEAEILVAEKVLEWLEKEEKNRGDQYASLMDSTS
ncbi:hypothetical protein FVEG_08214 [Fusarium verticillioides 7600]|uniref:Uncharacterized protein n=1 Tax=Gibberella moniliformis (strain M3125 / FGSC 7600) TaxID=334819 RepID=W7MVJ6_GIBM7|nr:hypothetical protein FVEG_08214 [Fusarium verticillioides 7600]EWG48437.1 hypothetical protein FVEG_08214 [Fusarium verticillioides 7600]RBQ90629.1 hypothetical protein FVER53263_08214 [Fusarium verticillioides]